MSPTENQSLIRVISILDCFTGHQHKLGIQEISERTKLPYSTTGRILQNLKNVDLLNQDSRTKQYYLGVRVLTWAGSYLNKMDLIEIAEPHLMDLFGAVQETISLYIVDHHERICIFRKESPQSLRTAIRIGEKMPLHLGAAGKFFLLQFSDEERWDYYKEHGLSDQDIRKMEENLLTIKKCGYSVTYGERVTDSASVAGPIFDFQRKIVAVANISGPINRFTEKIVNGYINQIKEISHLISHELGYVEE
jgi:IclR family transcriptional regulator, KDG regulon repressor